MRLCLVIYTNLYVSVLSVFWSMDFSNSWEYILLSFNTEFHTSYTEHPVFQYPRTYTHRNNKDELVNDWIGVYAWLSFVVMLNLSVYILHKVAFLSFVRVSDANDLFLRQDAKQFSQGGKLDEDFQSKGCISNESVGRNSGGLYNARIFQRTL